MENKIKNNRKRSLLLIGFILILIVSIMGGTYAYLAFSATNNSVVVGEIGVADLDLRVTKVTTNNGELVPQLEKALGTAVSSSHNCVDGNGNAVCQVYKIEIENTGTANIVVDGTIDFTNTTLPNLKYKLMTDSTTLDTSFNSRYGYGDMPDRPLVKGVSLEPEQTETYYIVLWINDTENEQPDTGTYRASINFNSSYLEGLTSTYVNYLVGFSGTSDKSYFRSDTYREKIKNISFVNYIDTTDAVESWDMGTLQNGGIMAWVENNATSGYYDLYIGSTEVIKGQNMGVYFYQMTYVDSMDFSNLDTSEVTNMQGMFYGTGMNSSIFTLDLGDNFDTSNVTNMMTMFMGTGRSSPVFTLDLGEKFDTSNVTNMYWMFYLTGGDYNSTFTLDLGDKFDTSNVTNMSGMFYKTGMRGSAFTLDLGDKFDTSNVTDMSEMFYYTSKTSNIFTLDLGDKFNTSNVTNMKSMFHGTGDNGINFALDLGDKFDTSNVTDMSNMFYQTGGWSSESFTLDLGDKFDTSNVTNMDHMFYQTGGQGTIFTLDLGDKFDTSKVTNMNHMFYQIGWSSSVFTLDLGDKFDTSNVTDMGGMFYLTGGDCPVFTLDLGNKFDTSKVTDMSNMFNAMGYANPNLELDLTTFIFDSVTNYTDMFFHFREGAKIYVKNQSDKDWLVSKGFSVVTNNNVIVAS